MRKNKFTPLDKKYLTGLSDFEKKVLKITSQIPLGEVRSYQWVARKLGKPKATRAVGQALKKNPYPIIIPCHRVIKSDGSLGGYVKGKRLKKKLLLFEKCIAEIIK
ncbi:MAG: MGMT family protein [Candidatus Omnitrophica bacterium]|nr:MGMT family protein [Candidatus Omnitrophota bacterium]